MAEEISIAPIHLHKKTERTVLLSTITVGDDSTCMITLKPEHELFSSHSGTSRATLVGLEIVRQLGLLIGHTVGNVPLDWAFLLEELFFGVQRGGGVDLFERASEVEISVEIDDMRKPRRCANGMAASASFRLDGNVVARGAGRFRCIPPRVYRALRSSAPQEKRGFTPHTGEALLGVQQESSQLRATLGWPTSDPLIFDHEVDHVPGMLLAQAGLAAHEILAGRPPASLSLTCRRFAEIGEETAIMAIFSGGAVRTVASQGAVEVAVVKTVGI